MCVISAPSKYISPGLCAGDGDETLEAFKSEPNKRRLHDTGVVENKINFVFIKFLHATNNIFMWLHPRRT